MARINKADHPRILQMVDTDRRKVADVAAEFGCSPASIYMLLKKLRDGSAPAEATAVEPPDTIETAETASPVSADTAPAGLDLFSAAAVETPATLPAAPPAALPPQAQKPNLAVVEAQPAAKIESRRSAPAPALKSGFGLAMRTAEGDESVAPFKSLDDLLSAIKPILRSAARSPDPVWFSIQQIDLASIDLDAT